MKKILSLGLILLLGNGCAVFRNNSIPEAVAFPQVQNQPSIALSFKLTHTVNGFPASLGADDPDELESLQAERFKQSGMFGTIGNKTYKADYTLKTQVKSNKESNVLGSALTGATLYVFPSCSGFSYNLRATLINNKTQKKSIIRLHDSYKLCQQLLLIFAAPFKPALTEPQKLRENLFDTLALRVHKEIEKQEKASKSSH